MASGEQAVITITMLDWWLGGTGETQTGGSDESAYRDEWGCPALPASQVKGTLRETAELWAGWPAQQIERFFGHRSAKGAIIGDKKRREGALLFGPDAGLPKPIRAALENDPERRSRLFSSVPATAIDPTTGTASDKSLRQIEVVVPMPLMLHVRWDHPIEQDDEWVQKLDHLCALTPAFGALKQDGFGRCVSACSSVATSREAAA